MHQHIDKTIRDFWSLAPFDPLAGPVSLPCSDLSSGTIVYDNGLPGTAHEYIQQFDLRVYYEAHTDFFSNNRYNELPAIARCIQETLHKQGAEISARWHTKEMKEGPTSAKTPHQRCWQIPLTVTCRAHIFHTES